MKLELKHLAPYLPYSLKGMEYLGGELFWLSQIDLTRKFPIIWESEINIKRSRTDCKPILRPLSDLTKEIEYNGEKFIPVEKLSVHLFDFNFIDYVVINKETKGLPYWVIEKLFEWHFDVFGLIEKSLAIDINTLNQ